MEKMGIVEKAQRSWKFVLLIMEVSKIKKELINKLQDEHGFHDRRTITIHIMDCQKQYTFKLVKGKLKLKLRFTGTPDATIILERLCTLKHLRQGFKYCIHPYTDKVIKMTYAPLDAWNLGDIKTFGSGVVNDVVALLKLFVTIISLIPEDSLVKIIGRCAHDGE